MDQDFVTNGQLLSPAGTKIIPASERPPPFVPDHKLLRCIGRGSYGTVWLARNMMGMFRAVKVVYRDSFTDRHPFERELSGIRRFEPISRSHEGFIDVLQVGINEEQGHFYYVMELGDDQISGQKIDPETYSPKTLGKEILLRRGLSFQECLELGLALSLALAELHKHGLVHRDVKPSNIIFVHGVPKLADIGLVAEADQAHSFVGTAGFIPPEGPGTAQADVYSLGKVLYEASTGKDRQDFPELPTLLDTLPDQEGFLELNEVILHACKNDMTKRYQTAWFLHADLLVLANGKSVRRLKILERRLSNLKKVAGISALICALVGVIGYQSYRVWKAANEARQRDVGANIAYGNRAMESGDLLGALPYFADALQLDEKNVTHRMRLGSVLAQCPKLTHMQFEETEVENGWFSPDGKKILIAEFFGKARIYDLKTGQIFLQPFGPEHGLKGVAYNPDGRFVATASEDHSVSIWDTANLKVVSRWPHPDSVYSARFSPDGLRVVTACEDGIARVWEVRTGKTGLTLQHGGAVRFADFSKDGQLIATCGTDRKVLLWNATTGHIVGKPLEHGGWVTSAAFSPDGKLLVTASGDHKARVWEVATGRKISTDLIHRDAVSSVEFSPDGRLILTASLDGTVHLWLADGFQPFEPNPVLRHGEKVMHAAFDAEGRRIITTCADGSVRVWDLAGSALPSRCPGSVFSRDGERVIQIANDTVKIQESGKAAPILIAVGSPVENAKFGHAARFIITSSSKQTQSNETGRILQVWSATSGELASPGLTFTNLKSDAIISDDGTRMAVVSGKTMQIWDVKMRTALSPPLFHRQKVGSALFSPNGNMVATVSGNLVHVWNAANGAVVCAPLAHSQAVTHIEFSPDGSRLVSCCSDLLFTKCYAQVWNLSTGQPVGPRLMHGDGVLFACFSPDGGRVATASEDFTAAVWDAVTGRRLATFPHNEKVEMARFSPDGSQILTASIDRTARVWSAETGDPLTPPLQHIKMLAGAQFLGRGDRVVTIDSRGIAQIWDLPLDQKPMGDVQKLARLLSGNMSISSRSLDQAQSGSLSALWQQFRSLYPSDFIVSSKEIEAWHEHEAQESEQNHQWSGVAFHLEQILLIRPDDPALKARLTSARANINKGA